MLQTRSRIQAYALETDNCGFGITYQLHCGMKGWYSKALTKPDLLLRHIACGQSTTIMINYLFPMKVLSLHELYFGFQIRIKVRLHSKESHWKAKLCSVPE